MKYRHFISINLKCDSLLCPLGMNTSSKWSSILLRSSEVNRHFFSAGWGVCCGADRLRPPGPVGDGRQEIGMEPVVIPSGNFWTTTFNPCWEDGEGHRPMLFNTQPSKIPRNSRNKASPPDSMKRFSKPLSHMVVAAWLAILSSSSYTIMIFPDEFFYIVKWNMKLHTVKSRYR